MSTIERARTGLGTGRLSPEELRLVEALRRGEESAFATLVDRYGASMLRASFLYAESREVAEEIVQDTWLHVLRGLRGYQGRSSLRTWIFAILGNCARKRAKREGRLIPFTALERDGAGPAVGPEHFFGTQHPRWPRCWSTLVDGWAAVPEERLLSAEVRKLVRSALGRLAPGQRTVMTLRDVEGWTAEEVCDFLRITPANQRVLLHRARAKVREAIQDYLDEEGGGGHGR
jgi:RNA polymerase sigma-70 factor (ECF subfamily)